MPIFDFQCSCGHIEERVEPFTVLSIKCPECGGKAEKILSVSSVFTANQDAKWIRSVRDVVQKDSGKRHCEEFLKDPTRQNYKVWMKKEGIRPLSDGEKVQKPDEKAIQRKITDEVYNNHRKRCALTI